MSSNSPRKNTKKSFFEPVVLKYPARRKQVEQLATLVGHETHLAYPCIFINGPSATGKTAVVKSFLKTLKLPHAWINCIEAYTPRLLMESVLNQISEVIPSPDNDFNGYCVCLNMSDFVLFLKEIITEKELDLVTVYLVFDNSERLREMPPTFLAALLRLHEITELNISILLLSQIIWEKFRNGLSFYEPFQISFPQYSKDETVSILERDCPSEIGLDCYRHYINLVLSVFFMVTRNLQELRYLAMSNFSKYYEPVTLGEANETDVRKLWRNIEPDLRKSLNTVYLRETNVSDAASKHSQMNNPIYEIRANVELPFFSKFLLIAAYIASYNPPGSDKRFFMKNTGKVYKRKSGVRKSALVNQHQKGPKMFPLCRLLSIFYVIVEEKVSPNATLMSQISNLVSLRLLAVSNGTDHPLSSPKYKCLVNLDFIRSISSTVRFDIVSYLFDFVSL